MKNILKWACEFGYETIIKCFVDRGLDVQGNKYALKWACKNGTETTCKILSITWSSRSRK